MKSTIAGAPLALITGASSGIGESTARVLHRAGFRSALTARRLDRLERLKGELSSVEGVFALDVTCREKVLQVVEQIEREIGPIDILLIMLGELLDRRWRKRRHWMIGSNVSM